MQEAVLVPRLEPVVKRRYRLRWRFDFAGRPSRSGVWDGASDLPQDSAWAVPKDGLVRAVVEAESLFDHSLKTLVEVDGQAFATASWEAHARMSGLGPGGPATIRGRVHGLSLWTADEKITAYVDGSVARRPLTVDERRFHIREHSAGGVS